MDDNKKLILTNYYIRYRNFGRTDDEISNYLLQNNFATKQELEDILKQNSLIQKNQKKINEKYKIIGISIGVILILSVIILGIMTLFSSEDTDLSKENIENTNLNDNSQNNLQNEDDINSKNQNSNIKKDNLKQVNNSSKNISQINVSKSNLVNNVTNTTLNQTKLNITNQNISINSTNTTKINVSKDTITNTTKTKINNSNNSSQLIRLTDIVFKLENTSLINQTLNLSWEIINYPVVFQDELYLIYRDVNDTLDCEEHFKYEEFDISSDAYNDDNKGNLIDNTNLKLGKNYYNLCLYVEAYDRYAISETLVIELNSTNVPLITEIKFKNLYDCNQNFTYFISKIEDNQSAMLKIDTNLIEIFTNININYSTTYKYEKLEGEYFGFNINNFLENNFLNQSNIDAIKNINTSYNGLTNSQIEGIVREKFINLNKLNESKICLSDSKEDYISYLFSNLDNPNLSDDGLNDFAICEIIN